MKKPAPKAPVLRVSNAADPTGLDAFETPGQIVVEVRGVKVGFLSVDFDGHLIVTTYGRMAILPLVANALKLEVGGGF